MPSESLAIDEVCWLIRVFGSMLRSCACFIFPQSRQSQSLAHGGGRSAVGAPRTIAHSHCGLRRRTAGPGRLHRTTCSHTTHAPPLSPNPHARVAKRRQLLLPESKYTALMCAWVLLLAIPQGAQTTMGWY